MRANRDAIREVAAGLFLRGGYQATSMDEVAARAGISKQTLYKQFGGKEQLFSEILLGNSDTAARFAGRVRELLSEVTDLDRDLGVLAIEYLHTVIQPTVLQLRRLVIGETERFPELARSYYDKVVAATMAALAEGFASLTDQGLLAVDDPARAAQQFGWLVIGEPINRAMFSADDERVVAETVDSIAIDGVRVFLAAYRA